MILLQLLKKQAITVFLVAGCSIWQFSNALPSLPFSTIEATSVSVDGTDLEEETRAYIADLLHISISFVSAEYCCQLLDGRYKYNVTAGTQSGFVFWTILNGEIIGIDDEGY